MEMDRLARLAVAETIAKACKEITDPRGGKSHANLRTEVDDALRDLYAVHGVSQQEIRVNGEKVGTISARLSKPEHVVRPEIFNLGAFTKWLREDGEDYLLMLIDKHKDEVVSWCSADGVLPDGCKMTEHDEPAHWLGTTMRVDAKKTVAALKGELPQAVAGLLEGK